MWPIIWQKLVAFHRASMTIALAHAVGWVSLAMEAIVQFPDVAAAVGLAQHVPPAWVGRYTLGIAVLTLFARLRTLRKVS